MEENNVRSVKTEKVKASVSSKSSKVEYFVSSVSASACFPQTLIEGVEIDGVNIQTRRHT